MKKLHSFESCTAFHIFRDLIVGPVLLIKKALLLFEGILEFLKLEGNLLKVMRKRKHVSYSVHMLSPAT